MLNHSHSRPDSRCAPFLLHGHAADTDHRDRAAQQQQQQQGGMDPPSSSGRSTPTTPRRQLQGPRPPRLNVRMESHAIKKPSAAASSSVAPPAALAAPGGQGRPRDHHQHQPPARAPVIIYDASPKVIHAKPSEFMALVQRLTGPGSGAAQPAPPPDAQGQAQYMVVDDGDGDAALLGQAFLPPELLLSPSAAMSPAARLATIERSVRPMPAPATDYDVVDVHGVGVGGGGGRADDGTLAAVLGPALARHPGILSPLPSALPPAAASGLFSPLPFDAGGISWLNELSPILRAAAAAGGASSSGGFGAFGPGAGGGATGNGGGSRAPPPAYYSDPFVPSPRNLLATPTVPSPATCAEFFGSLPDL